jgi:hypothetical protein
MMKKLIITAFVILFANVAFSQTDDLNFVNDARIKFDSSIRQTDVIDFKNDARLKLNSSLKDYSGSSLDRAFERRRVLEDTIVTPFGAYEQNRVSTLTFDSTYVPKKNYLYPIGEIILLNGFVWSMSAYIVPAPWAKISINSVKENWAHQWVWDSDHFRTNQFSHPYHGSLSFNFARSSGLTFWEAAPYTLFGSYMWEMCMEINYPSRNDLITTTMGGIALGEITYRLSSKILDERTRGGERVWREIGAFLLAPTRGVNRLFRGEMGKVKQKSSYEIEDVMSSISIGPSLFYKPGQIYNANGNVAFRLDMYYGNPYSEKNRKPYDYFNLKTIFNAGTQPLINQVSVIGFLIGKNYKYKADQKILFGLFQHFDYYSNTAYEIFGQSIGPGIIYKFPTLTGVDFQTSLHFAGIVLGGGSNIPEAFKYEADGTAFRSYNFSIGFTSKFESILSIKNRAYLFLGLYDFQFYTEDGADGRDNLFMFNPRVGFAVTPTTYVGMEYNLFHRMSHYVKYNDFRTTVNELKLFISNSF